MAKALAEKTIKNDEKKKPKSLFDNSDPFERPIESEPAQVSNLQDAIGNQAVNEQLVAPSTSKSTSEQPEIPTQDIQYEFIAHHIAYQDEIGKVEEKKPRDTEGNLLSSWGYKESWEEIIDDRETDLFVGLLMPDPMKRKNHPNLKPVLVFRGTWEGYDWVSDSHPVAVGYDQFNLNHTGIEKLIESAGGTVDVVGHSLGGALAQHAAIEFPNQISRVVTFQSPGIGRSQARAFGMNKGGPSVTHHLTEGDLVDLAGEHIQGTFYRHDTGNTPLTHMDLLFSTPAFEAQRNSIGLTAGKLTEMDLKQAASSQPATASETYPFSMVKKRGTEGTREFLGRALYPILSRQSDSEIRNQVWIQGNKLQQSSANERGFLLNRLALGITFDADELTILKILEVSRQSGDEVKVIDTANAWYMANAVDGEEYQILRRVLNENYYGVADQHQVLDLIQICMDGETAEWEEQMIADILVARQRIDGNEIIRKIGEIYENGGFNEGLNKLEWQLDLSDQRRVAEVYGISE